MPSNYKSFTINNTYEAEPWDETEVQFHQDLINTVVIGCCSETKQSTNGHRHYRLFETTGASAALSIDANSDATFAGSAFFANDESILLGNTLASPKAKIILDTSTTPDELRIDQLVDGNNLRIKNDNGGSVGGEIILEVAASTDSKVGVRFIGDDWGGNPYEHASSNNFRFALIDENGRIRVGTTDVAINVS